MLTATQCQLAGIQTDGAYLCVDCAENKYGARDLERLRVGIYAGAADDLTPLIRYTVDEIRGEEVNETLREDGVDYDADAPDVWNAAYDAAHDIAGPTCDDCGERLPD